MFKGQLTPRRDAAARRFYIGQILYFLLYLLHEKIPHFIERIQIRWAAQRCTSRRLAAQRDVSRLAVTHGVQERLIVRF
jgi:hypothetical protein